MVSEHPPPALSTATMPRCPDSASTGSGEPAGGTSDSLQGKRPATGGAEVGEVGLRYGRGVAEALETQPDRLF